MTNPVPAARGPSRPTRMRPRTALIPTIALLTASRALAQSEPLGSPESAAGGMSWPSLLLWAGGVLLALWGASRILPALRARQAQQTHRASVAAPDPEDLRALARDLEELADRLALRLDEKAERLERLLARADEQLSALEDSPSPTYSNLGSARTKRAPAPRLVTESGDPSTERIYALADSGVGAKDIAQQLDEPIGKVQLILALRG